MKHTNQMTAPAPRKVANPGGRLAARSGQTMIVLALSVTAMLAVAGLVLDGGMIYFEKRRMQAAVDAGAFGGSHELRRGNNDLATQIRPAVVNVTELNGYADSNSTITVNVPPVSGRAVGDTNFLEVSIERNIPTFFLRMLGVSASTVRTRAVAGVRAMPDACIIALDPDDRDSLMNNGSSTLIVNCGVMVNSYDPLAFRTPGGGCVDATWIGVTGGYSVNCVNCASPSPMPGVPPIIDPLANLDPPTVTGTGNDYTFGDTTFYTPGYYAQQISIQNGNHVFLPGIYEVEKGVRVTGGNVFGARVCFYNSCPSGNHLIDFGANATVNLSAPKSGQMQGMLFYTPRTTPNKSPGNKLARGNEDSSLVGVLYFPSQHINFAGNPETAIGWTMVIANTIDISGTAGVQVVNPPPGNGGPPVYSSLMLE